MKISIASESISAYTENNLEILVVSIRKYSKISWVSGVLIVRCRRNLWDFSYLGYLVRTTGVMQSKQTEGVSEELLFSWVYSFILSIVNLFTGSWGEQISSHSIQNPVCL